MSSVHCNSIESNLFLFGLCVNVYCSLLMFLNVLKSRHRHVLTCCAESLQDVAASVLQKHVFSIESVNVISHLSLFLDTL